jgi:amino acid adenylation domain-containing protein
MEAGKNAETDAGYNEEGLSSPHDTGDDATDVTNRNSGLPLSLAQERLWLLEQFQPFDEAYNVSAAFRLLGRLDVAALELAIDRLVSRHDVLRMRIEPTEGIPTQVIDPPGRISVSFSCVEGPESSKQPELRRLMLEATRFRFDLTTGPVFRFQIIRLTPDEHILMFVAHHIVADSGSTAIILRELARLYEGLPLAALPMQFADFALWQRRDLSGDRADRHLEYWKNCLAGAPAALELPTDRPRRPVQGYHAAGVPLEIPAHASDQLRTLALSESTSISSVLIAAFTVVMARWSGQKDLVIGNLVSGRMQPKTGGLVGLLENLLPLRINLSGDPQFRDLLRKVADILQNAHAHQELAFERLLQALQPPRDLSRSPLCQVMVSVVERDLSADGFSSLRVERIPDDGEISRYDLALHIAEAETGPLQLRLQYATDLFDKSTIQRLSGHLVTLLECIAGNANARLSTLAMVGLDELSRRDPGSLDKHPDGPEKPGRIAASSSLTECFAKQVALRCDAPAIVSDQGNWSYTRLCNEAGRIASLLTEEQGDEAEPIGLLFEHEPNMVAAMLGVLGAGKFYIPLSPNDPPARLRAILKENRCTCLLVGPGLRASGQAIDPEISIVSVDTIEREPVRLRSRSRGSVAYILNTSGTTGTPKSVAQCDRNVLHHISNYATTLSLGPEDRMVLLAAYSSDAAVKNIFGTLFSGGTLCLWDVRRKGLGSLQSWLVANGVTVWHSTASLLRVALPLFPGPANLRWIVLGGELAKIDDLALVVSHGGPRCRLLVGYSQTECSTAIQHLPDPEVDLNSRRLPIGRAVSGTRVVLLDTDGIPTDLYGEIAIVSRGAALGYWRRPGLTGERFIPDPVGHGERLFRTGDLGRWREDGNLELVGRIDHQVKLRGFRVELREIETALLALGEVREAVVMVYEDDFGEKQLVGYVVLAEHATRADSREFGVLLRERLPDYMVPSAFVVLEALPLLPNGKLDRKALPVPEKRLEIAGYVPPRTPIEEVLASIWCEVLRVDRVGIHDNFFELGGHSLLAMQVMARIRDSFALELPLRALFEEDATVHSLAKLAETTRQEEHGPVPSLSAQPRESALPLSFAQERLWFLEQLYSLGSSYHEAVVFRLEGEMDVAAFERSFVELIRRHESLRTRFATVDGEGMRAIDAPAAFRLEVADLGILNVEERQVRAQQLIQAESERLFDLEQGPLIRVSLLRLAAAEHIMLVTMHHIISDDWSMRSVLPHELGTLYTAFSQGLSPSLSALPVQYGDYAVWQRNWLQGDVLERQLAYWRGRLAGAETLELPTDYPRPAVPTFKGARVPVAVRSELSAALVKLGRSRGATLYMVLLAAFQLLLSRWSGQQDVIVGSPIAGRTHRQTEGLIGFFATTLVLRTDLSGAPSFHELLDRVKETALGAYDHQDIPFEKLVAELQLDRDLSRQPLFQVMFALQNVPREALQLPGLRLRPAERPRRTAKFDLFLQIAEDADGLAGSIEYATDLFEQATIERMAGHFRMLLEGIVADPEQPVSDLSLLEDAERHQLVVEWNETTVSNHP